MIFHDNNGQLKSALRVMENRGYHGNAPEYFKINSSTKLFLNHSRNMFRKFQGSNLKTPVEDRFLRFKKKTPFWDKRTYC